LPTNALIQLRCSYSLPKDYLFDYIYKLPNDEHMDEAKIEQIFLISMPFYVLKLGGSLIESANALMSALLDLSREGYCFLVIPGGGPMADLVQELYDKGLLSDESAHWMAILAMEQYAYLLADGTGAVLTTEISRSDGVKVLLPYRALQEDDMGMEHSWDYTSDSVAVLIASRLNSNLIKATDVDGIIIEGELREEVSATFLKGIRTCLDQGSIRLLKDRSCWILNGTDPQKFINSVLSGKGGTIIKGE
jgi:aspartokinase-like uncharacterized kinase